MSPHEYDVRAAPHVSATLRAWKLAAVERPTSAQGMLFRAIKSLVDTILSDPAHACAPKHALTGDLRGIFRVKHGRFRVFYICAPTLRRVVLLDVGVRKAGAKDDAYDELRARLRRGELDVHFAELGLVRPDDR